MRLHQWRPGSSTDCAIWVPFDGGQDHNGDLASCKILLVRHGSVSGGEDFESVVLGSSEKLAIFSPDQASQSISVCGRAMLSLPGMIAPGT